MKMNHLFTLKYLQGKRNWTVNLPHKVSTISSVQLAHLGVHLIAVAMNNGLIQFYNGKHLVDVLPTQGIIYILKFFFY